MSTSDLLFQDTSAHSIRKCWRWIPPVLLILLLFHLSDVRSSTSFSRLQIVKSSYDWSQWEPYHPVESLQPLPSTKPKKLPKIQHTPARPHKFDVAVQEQRRSEVKRVAAKAWKSYREFAWMSDELMPISAGSKNTFGGWAATLIDSLDTLWIMGMKSEFNEAVRAVATLDWANYQGSACNVFETTIRHLGGLLAAYDLSKESVLLEKAVELGDLLYAGFDSPTHLPPFWLDFEKAKTGQLVADFNQPAASVTTLSMEFTRLAQLTGNHKYYDAVARVTDHLYYNQNLTKLPGMWPMHFDLRHGVFTHDNTFTLGALSDSMYEYVLKMHLLLGGAEPKYEEMYRQAADTIIKNLLFRPMTPKNHDILFSGTLRVGDHIPLDTETQHLACFAGGMFALGGKVYGIPEHVDIGARLTHGCMWAYNTLRMGIAPDTFKLLKCESPEGCKWDEQRWLDATGKSYEVRENLPKGFESVRDPSYILRPEAIESVFVLYRITGHEEYREAAWTMFENIQNATETNFGNAAIADVLARGRPQLRDSMEVSHKPLLSRSSRYTNLEYRLSGWPKLSNIFILSSHHRITSVSTTMYSIQKLTQCSYPRAK